MKKWMVHYGVRYTKDIEIEAETLEEAKRKAEEDRPVFDAPDGWDFTHDDYDIWEVKDEIKIGDSVIVTNAGARYRTYTDFFRENNLGDKWKRTFEVNQDYEIFPSVIYKVIYKAPHGISTYEMVYLISDYYGGMYLISEDGIEKVEE